MQVSAESNIGILDSFLNEVVADIPQCDRPIWGYLEVTSKVDKVITYHQGIPSFSSSESKIKSVRHSEVGKYI